METDATVLPALGSRRGEPKGEVRRAALLQALESLLHERELAQISVGQIATRAGLTRSAFYFYFPSKEAAVTDLLREVFEGLLAGARRWIEGTEDPLEALTSAIAGTVAEWRRHRHLLLALLDARGDAEVRELYDRWVSLFVAPLAGAVRDERERGRAPQGSTDPETLIRLLLGMNDKALEHHLRAEEDERQAGALAEALARTWVAAIYGRDAA